MWQTELNTLCLSLSFMAYSTSACHYLCMAKVLPVRKGCLRRCGDSDVPAQMSVADREQEVMSTAGLASIGGSGTVGHGVMERVLRIAPGAQY